MRGRLYGGLTGADHTFDEHIIMGDPREQLRRIIARHLCGWISGHGTPIRHFLVDADLIMDDVDAAGLEVVRRGANDQDSQRP